MDVHTGDFRGGDWLQDAEVALALCDPPYRQVDLYAEPAAFAARKLRPGGFLAVYADVFRLPKVRARVGSRLD